MVAATETKQELSVGVPTSEKKETVKVYSPNVDVHETAESLLFFVEMPGVDPSSVDVTIEKNQLTIEGKFVEGIVETGKPLFQEFKEGNYFRKFTIGKTIDSENVKAVVKNGFLELVIPKLEPKKKKIDIQ
ncbi:Hsp20/alpha crystallin family protein [Leptospira idonii]|uniref:Hsp20/alpha crystallin family protein n=1 Tax=Leptospira idonii TaxID=1193500 RepID=A0A4R9LWN7_9LEPT|nr:Hsp20/alpha crystallin family protein [Leptospira idonii]TGN18703.1 Hsp20/alpha crystallin family protein [Leptospira idonii]